MKKILSFLLAGAMTLSLAACGNTPAPSGTPGSNASQTPDASSSYKIGIMTTTVSQAEEEYRVAAQLAANNPDKVIHVTYPDNFATETETTISTAMSLADNPDVKGILFTQAVTGVAAAIEKIRAIRPDIFLWVGLPMEDNDVIAAAADVVFNTDFSTAGVQDAEAAKEMNIETIVHYSFPRHMAIATKASYRDNLRDKCAELGIDFVDVTTPDPTSDVGVTGTQQFVLEDVPKKLAEYGPNTAFYGTNLSQVEPIIKRLTEAKEGYYLIIKDPSPTFYVNPLGISVPSDKSGDYDYLNEQISLKVAELGMTGHFTGWPLSITNMSLNGGFQYVCDYVEGKTSGKVDVPHLQAILTGLAGEGASVKLYQSYENYFAVTAPSMTY